MKPCWNRIAHHFKAVEAAINKTPPNFAVRSLFHSLHFPKISLHSVTLHHSVTIEVASNF